MPPPALSEAPGDDAGADGPASGDPGADRDGDGIPDWQDVCPQTPGPRRTGGKGNGCPCIIARSDFIIVFGVNFPRDSAEPTPDGDAVIRAAVDKLKANPSMKIEVIGRASVDEADPQKTSTARAAAVVARLVHAGVDRKRLVARGEGSKRAPWLPSPAAFAALPDALVQEWQRFVEFNTTWPPEARGLWTGRVPPPACE